LTSPSTIKTWGWFGVKAAVSVGLMAFTLSRISLADALAAMGGLSLAALAAAAAIVILAHGVNALRLCAFLPELTFDPALRFTFIGTFYSTVLPSQLAGDAIKAVRLARVHDDAGRAVSAVVRDKIMGLAALIALSLAAVPLSEFPERAEVAAMLAVALLLTAALWLALDRLPRGGVWDRVAKYLPSAADAGLARRQLAINFLWGVVFQAMVVAIFAVVGEDLGLDVSAGAWVVVIGLVSIILLLPVTVAGIGLREGSLVGLMGALGQDAAATLAMSLVILALSLFAAAIGLALDLTSRDRTVSGA
jgi:uncharacterized membrane protein YbhN (UPF0104 family)